MRLTYFPCRCYYMYFPCRCYCMYTENLLLASAYYFPWLAHLLRTEVRSTRVFSSMCRVQSTRTLEEDSSKVDTLFSGYPDNLLFSLGALAPG